METDYDPDQDPPTPLEEKKGKTNTPLLRRGITIALAAAASHQGLSSPPKPLSKNFLKEKELVMELKKSLGDNCVAVSPHSFDATVILIKFSNPVSVQKFIQIYPRRGEASLEQQDKTVKISIEKTLKKTAIEYLLQRHKELSPQELRYINQPIKSCLKQPELAQQPARFLSF